jgi:DNA-binding MarR family transcriptional regulator
VEFGFLRTALDLTAGNLSQHLTVLEKAGLVAIEKGYEGKRARTWITLTAPGDKALRAEIHHLKSWRRVGARSSSQSGSRAVGRCSEMRRGRGAQSRIMGEHVRDRRGIRRRRNRRYRMLIVG